MSDQEAPLELSDEQIRRFDEEGFLFLPEALSREEIEALRSEVPGLFAEDSPRRVVEKDGHTVRSHYGAHQINQRMNRLMRHPRVLRPAEQILRGQVYLYQFKINAKAAFGGDVWAWHQDYIYWLKEDRMPSARVVNAFVFLDAVTEFNGPLFLVPRSHDHEIEVEPARRGFDRERRSPYKDSPDWITNLIADLKYTLDQETVARLVSRSGMVAPKGPPGSILFTHGNIVHASSTNISPFSRTLAILTYNSTENAPVPPGPGRPDFIVSHKVEPLSPLSVEELKDFTR